MVGEARTGVKIDLLVAFAPIHEQAEVEAAELEPAEAYLGINTGRTVACLFLCCATKADEDVTVVILGGFGSNDGSFSVRYRSYSRLDSRSCYRRWN